MGSRGREGSVLKFAEISYLGFVYGFLVFSILSLVLIVLLLKGSIRRLALDERNGKERYEGFRVARFLRS